MASAVDRNFALFALRELSMARTTERLVAVTERLAHEVSGSEARLFGYDAERQVLVRMGADGGTDLVDLSGDTLAGRCQLAGRTLVEGPPAQGPSQDHAAAFPLHRYGVMVGVLTVARSPVPFHRDLVETLEELCAVAAHLGELVAGLEDADEYMARTRDVLVRSVEGLSPGQEGHVMRVTRVAAELATGLDLSARSRQLLWQAAQYHDVGKVILAGDAPSEIKSFHFRAAAEFLQSSRALRPVAEVLDGIHRWHRDSSRGQGGWPDDVPLESWILAMAEDLEDVYLTHDRKPIDDWIGGFLEQCRPSHHPAVADALRTLVGTGRLQSIYRASA
jgi:hypothetical protein